jgi:hypothetical protein
MKRYSIEYDRRAEKQVRAIRDLRLALAVQAAIEDLAQSPRPPGCLKMSGPGDEWRIRVGDDCGAGCTPWRRLSVGRAFIAHRLAAWEPIARCWR